MSAISDYDLGWLVGLLEGEAHFGYYSQTQRVVLRMTDEDTVLKCASLFEQITGQTCNVVEEMKGHIENHQHTFLILIYGERARTIMELVVKRMSFRRRKKIHQALNKYNVLTRHKSKAVPKIKPQGIVIPIKRRV